MQRSTQLSFILTLGVASALGAARADAPVGQSAADTGKLEEVIRLRGIQNRCRHCQLLNWQECEACGPEIDEKLLFWGRDITTTLNGTPGKV